MIALICIALVCALLGLVVVAVAAFSDFTKMRIAKDGTDYAGP